jgi:hypothetical protein
MSERSIYIYWVGCSTNIVRSLGDGENVKGAGDWNREVTRIRMGAN